MEASDCPICYSRYERPLILSCGHSLCTACVDRMKQAETARGVGGGAFRAFMDPVNDEDWAFERRQMLHQREILRNLGGLPPVPPPPGGANAGGGAAAADAAPFFNDAGAFDQMRVMHDALVARDFPLPAPAAGAGGRDRLGMEGMMQAAGVLRGRLRDRENRDVQHRIKCPECRVETIIPRNGLPINYRLQDVLSREAPSTSSAGAAPAQPPVQDTAECLIKCQVCRCDLPDSYFTCAACCPAQQGHPTPFCPRCAIHFHNGHDVEEVVPVTDNERNEAKSDIEASLVQVNNLFEESTRSLAGDTDTWNDTSEAIVNVITAMTALVDEVAQAQLMRPRALQLVQLAQQAYSEVDLVLNKYRNFRRHLQECAALMRLTAERVTAAMNGQEMPPGTNNDPLSARDVFQYRYPAGPAVRRVVMDRAAVAANGNENDPMWRRVDVMRRLREARRAERRVEGYRRDAREAARVNDAPIDVVGDHIILVGNGQADAAPQLNNNNRGVVDVQPMEEEHAVDAAQFAGVEMPMHMQDNVLNVDLNAPLPPPPAGTIYAMERRQEVWVNGVPVMDQNRAQQGFVPPPGYGYGQPVPIPNGNGSYTAAVPLGHVILPQGIFVPNPNGHMQNLAAQPPQPIHHQFNAAPVANPAPFAPASARRIARASAPAAAAPAHEEEHHPRGLVQGGQAQAEAPRPGGSAGDSGPGGEDDVAPDTDVTPPVKKVRRRRSGSGPGSR